MRDERTPKDVCREANYFSDPQKINIREIYSHTYGKHEFVCCDQVFPLLFFLILLITSNKKKILKYYCPL